MQERDLEPFRTELEVVPPGHVIFEVMSHKGDDKYIWDITSRDSIEIAKEVFDKFKKKGYLAYKVVGEEGKKGEQMHTFDEKAGRIIFSPPLRGG